MEYAALQLLDAHRARAIAAAAGLSAPGHAWPDGGCAAPSSVLQMSPWPSEPSAITVRPAERAADSSGRLVSSSRLNGSDTRDKDTPERSCGHSIANTHACRCDWVRLRTRVQCLLGCWTGYADVLDWICGCGCCSMQCSIQGCLEISPRYGPMQHVHGPLCLLPHALLQ